MSIKEGLDGWEILPFYWSWITQTDFQSWTEMLEREESGLVALLATNGPEE